MFTGVVGAARPVEIDLHAKGLDQPMIDNALAPACRSMFRRNTGVSISAWPIITAGIREFEVPAPGQIGKGLLTLSEGTRSSPATGMPDFLRDDRRYSVRHRIFPGTQHLLASCPDAAYGGMFGFCGSAGADLMEPLTYRGRRGSAVETSARSGYAAAERDDKWDWRKYQAWYRGFGRSLYNPQTVRPPEDALTTAVGLGEPYPAAGYHGLCPFGGLRCLLAGSLLEPSADGRACSQSLQ